MKNTLAENMLRFGVKNLKADDVKKIEEAVLTEAVINKDLYADPKWKKAIDAVAAKQPEGSMTPYNVGQYIFVPTDPSGKGIITTFTTGYYGLPFLNPLNDSFNKLPLAILQAAYANNPSKATYDKMIATFKNTVAQTQPGTRSAQQTLAASLTGNAKAMLVG